MCFRSANDIPPFQSLHSLFYVTSPRSSRSGLQLQDLPGEMELQVRPNPAALRRLRLPQVRNLGGRTRRGTGEEEGGGEESQAG